MQKYRRCNLLILNAFYVPATAPVVNFSILSSYNHIFNFNNFLLNRFRKLISQACRCVISAAGVIAWVVDGGSFYIAT